MCIRDRSTGLLRRQIHDKLQMMTNTAWNSWFNPAFTTSIKMLWEDTTGNFMDNRVNVAHLWVRGNQPWSTLDLRVKWQTFETKFLDKTTGCPISKFPLCFLWFSRVLEHIQRNFWHLFNSPGNLLHDSHKNFENWFRNSWDNWGQSWHLWHQNYFFDSV